jgi:hypothetical protein
VDIHFYHPNERLTGQFNAYLRAYSYSYASRYLNRDAPAVQKDDIWLIKQITTTGSRFNPISFGGDELGVPDLRPTDLKQPDTTGWSCGFSESSVGGWFGNAHKCFWRWDLPGGFSFLD